MTVSDVAGTAVNAALSHSAGGFSPAEQKMLNTLSGPDKARMEAQLSLQKQQETVAFISKVLKNEGTMSVINNMK